MSTSITNRAKSITFAVTAGVGLLGFMAGATQAHAAGPLDPLTQNVGYGDLNLDTEAGAKVLYRRLRTASEAVCRPLDGRDLAMNEAWHACYDNAMARAVQSINKSAVTALYRKTRGDGAA